MIPSTSSQIAKSDRPGSNVEQSSRRDRTLGTAKTRFYKTLRRYYRATVPQALRQSCHDYKIHARLCGWKSAALFALHRGRRRLLSDQAAVRWAERRLQSRRHGWLFVLGVNNSGTTLLTRILDSHALIRSLPHEGQFLTNALPLAHHNGVGRMFSERPDLFRWDEDSDPGPAARAMYDWAFHYDRRPGILLEKSPSNMLRASWLQRYFQPCRFLRLVRHPYAVCEGIRRRTGRSIEDAARHWVRANETVLEDLKHLERHLLVRYEDLCEACPVQLHRIQQFCELDEPFNADIVERPFSVHNMDKSPQP